MVAGENQRARRQPYPGDEEDVLSSKKPSRMGPLVTRHLSLATAPNEAKKKPARQHCGGLVATFTNSKFDLTDSQHARYENSSRNKFALFGNEPAVQEAESRLEAGGTKSKATSKKRQPAGRQRYIKQKDGEQILIDRIPIRNRCNSLKTNDGGDF